MLLLLEYSANEHVSLCSFGRTHPRCSAFNFTFGGRLLLEGVDEHLPEVGIWINRDVFHWIRAVATAELAYSKRKTEKETGTFRGGFRLTYTSTVPALSDLFRKGHWVTLLTAAAVDEGTRLSF